MPTITPRGTEVTPYRQTHVLFDTPQDVLVQQAVSYERIGRQIARNSPENKVNTVYYPGIGWRLKSYIKGNGYLYERTQGQDSVLPSSALIMATGTTQINRNRKITGAEVTGIDTGSSSNLSSTAFPMIRRLWQDTDDVSTLGLSTASFSQPDTSDPSYVMDRIVETKNQYTYENEFAFQLDLPSMRLPTPDAVATFYFPGLASETIAQTQGNYITGRGEYAFKLYGDGRATLWERTLELTWVSRSYFTWASDGAVMGKMHVIHIVQSPANTLGSGAGGTISFKMGTWRTSTDVSWINLAAMQQLQVLGTDPDSDQSYVYAVPRASGNTIASHACQLRVDIRRDLRGAEFAMCVAKFPSSGTLTCDPFKLSSLSIGTSSPFVLQWDGDVPSDGSGGTGAALDLKLYSRLTNAELPSPTVLSSNTKSYPVPAASGSAPYITDQFYVIATFTSSSNHQLSPTLRSYKVFRNAIVDNTGTTEYEFVTDSSGGNTVLTKAIEEFQITGSDKDISHEMANIMGADITGSYAALGIRSGMPMSIWTSYDPLDSSKKWWLYDGYIHDQKVTPLTGTGALQASGFGGTKAFPPQGGHLLDLPSNGKWQRLKEFSFPLVQQMMQNSDGTRFKVTDMVKYILLWAGFTANEINIPDSPILLYGKGGSQYFSFETFANGLDVIQSILADFLGWFLVWDRNIGTDGMFRALPQVRKTTTGFTNVAAFISGPPPQADGSKRVISNVNSYPLASTLGDGLTYTATAPTIFINKGTLQKTVIPPEGNFLYASCIAQGSSTGVGQLLTITIPNRKSYNFDPNVATADPNDKDYLGRMVPIYYIVPSLNGASGDDAGFALSRIARRIFDYACHGIQRQTFEAPMVPITNDYDASKVRSLRYYDPVSVDGVQYLVRNFNPHWTKDSAQMAMLEVEMPNF